MSESTTETMITESEPTTEETPGEPQSPAETDAPKANSEARFRQERNAAREELLTANGRIERMQRAEVERLASEHLSMPGDVFSLSGNELADYLTEDGEVDAEKVAADVAAVLAERPGLRRNALAVDPTQGTGGAPAKSSPASWSDLFKS
jgi:hypothetical protein